MKRFWFTFAGPPEFSPLALGCGVTGHDRLDALQILRERVLAGRQDLAIDVVVEDVDIRTLDADHVVPNMGAASNRGVWFPLGY
ncbi:hypothetical protein K4L06_13245 [Lysobacter sp. BMK333-48F3]|uniref:hypothetical protein n=1 Tax=Lysobacter sp. BMK333-48F3 TaxID=2867962 RepID=UPI001C8BF303|nr:hypothetical protein [Lysobacter sp. BMK333-48F3]MBX9402274.1 hypothetical protein [Lysobacter sp. BMK333-48F3]